MCLCCHRNFMAYMLMLYSLSEVNQCSHKFLKGSNFEEKKGTFEKC